MLASCTHSAWMWTASFSRDGPNAGGFRVHLTANKLHSMLSVQSQEGSSMTVGSESDHLPLQRLHDTILNRYAGDRQFGIAALGATRRTRASMGGNEEQKS